MANGLDPIAASSQSDGRWKIAWLPAPTGTTVNPTDVAEVLAGVRLTYSFTSDGWNPSTSQDTVDDKRLTLKVNLSRPGKVTDTLSVKYVESSDKGSANVVLTQDATGYFVVRRANANETDWAAGDLVDIWSVQCGAQRPAAPTENGVDTVEQDMFITNPTQKKVALIASGS